MNHVPDTAPGRSWLLLAAFLACAGLALAKPSRTLAAGPWWHLESRAAPSNLQPGGEGELIVAASDVGTAEADGAKQLITLADKLPPRLTPTSISGGGSYPEETPPMSCSLEKLTCTYTGSVLPYKRLEVTIKVKVAAGPSGTEDNTVTVEGGGAPTPPPLTQALTIASGPTTFGVENYRLQPEQEGGASDHQAGSHPFQLTATFDLNQTLATNAFGEGPFPQAPALTRNLSFHLPPGLVGNPTAAAQCADVAFSTIGEDGFTDLCPSNTAVGAAVVTIYEPVLLKFSTVTVPLFNLVPARGEPARFGFEVFKVPVVLDTAVKASEGYSVTVNVTNASQAAAILGSQVTFWGQPGSASHDRSRGWACLDLPFLPERGALKDCVPPTEHSAGAFLTLPTSCSGHALPTTVEGTSWPTAAAPAGIALPPATALIEPLEGCGLLPFTPTIETEPDQHSASTPTGLTVAVKLPQESTLTAGELAESAVASTTVTLPNGMLLNPAAATGLLACSAAQVGVEPGGEAHQSENDTFTEAAPECPEAAKVATVSIRTPLLDHELHGAAYLASQNTNPFAPPLVLYLLIDDPISGVQIKLAGTVTPNALTGQLSSTFSNTPQLPFESLKLHFFDGRRASLSTPPTCGSYGSQAALAPWSGGAIANATSGVTINSGAEGSGCPSPPGLAPTFNAQSTSTQAGAFTGFTLHLGHRDQDQPLGALTIHLPPGVAAILPSVVPCPEPQASRGECGPESQIGHATAFAGLGPEPYSETGTVYLTGPYGGAPFGLSIATPAVAGPFNLGTIVVRAAINVDPRTAAVTITSTLPTFAQGVDMAPSGVPLQLKQINVTVDRPGFEFNPTSCAHMAVTGVVTGSGGAAATVSSPFQVAGCGNLPFAPKLTASVAGHASKVNGTRLSVTVASAGLGQANIAKVDLQLPLALPSRLTTLQKACLASVFSANPANCSPESIIGTATIHTPVLRNPLVGPAYLVSYGSTKFPDVEFLLQGEGITVLLDGATDIKNGITYSRFDSAPDAPFTRFETVLPAGPHSALTAYTPKTPYDLCGSALRMPTEITSQAGTTIREITGVTPTGCPAVKSYKVTRAQQLAKALRVCRTKYRHSPARRAKCEKIARRKYKSRPRGAPRAITNKSGRGTLLTRRSG